MQPDQFVERFLKPYLAEHYPNADLVILAGSLGRLMKNGPVNGEYPPTASSDADLIIIYKDLEKDGLRTATKIYKLEDVGTTLEGKPREMMIDSNVHDLASLIYHYEVVRNHAPYAFVPVMVDEGCIIFDRMGIGPILQRQAREFLDAGPALPPKIRFQPGIGFAKTYLDDIRAASSVEEKRFLGVLALQELCEYVLEMHGYWRSGSNQAYRSFERKFSDEGKIIKEAFSALCRTGEPVKAEEYLESFLARATEFEKALPEAEKILPYGSTKYVSHEEAEGIDRIFCKYMAEHLMTSFEKSQSRGEFAFLESMSGSIRFIKKFMEQEGEPVEGRAALAFLSKAVPDLLPVTLKAIDEGQFQPLVDIADNILKPVDGIHYKELVNYYLEDVARVHAIENESLAQNAPAPVLKKIFKARYGV